MYFVEKSRGLNFAKRFDYILFISILILSIFGLIILYSATYNMSGGADRMKMQAVSLIIGICIAVAASFVDYKDFKTIGFIVYGISILLLIFVLAKGSGMETWGAKSWLKIGSLSFQPSEIAKISFVLVVSYYLEKHKESKNVKDLIYMGGFALLPVALVLKQPDAGTAMVFGFAFFVMIFIYGIPYRYLLMAAGGFTALAPVIWFFIFSDYQKDRIKVFLNPELAPLGAGYHVIRSKVTIGSGQIKGQGLLNGIQTQSGVVPIKESDFIFTVIGEELGFIGSMAFIAFVCFILFRLFSIARNARDDFGMYTVLGLSGMMTFHFIENIGMCVGVLPVTGIPLPFVSSGGSAMITNWLAIGIIMSISIRRKKPLFNLEE